MTAAILQQKTTHVAEALALLGEAFKQKPNMTALLTTFTSSVQELETVIWTVIDGYLLPSAVGSQLDSLGGLVDEPRQNRSDADYRLAIQIQIRVLHTHGRDEDIIEVAKLMLSDFTYTEAWPAGWVLDGYSVNVSAVDWIVNKLRETKAAGTAGTFSYSSHARSDLGNRSFVFGSVSGGVVYGTNGAGFDDSVSGPLAGTGFLGAVANV